MRPTNRCLAITCALVLSAGPVTTAQAFGIGEAVQRYQTLKDANKLPGLSRDGLTIPAPLLLERLQSRSTDALQIQSLSLNADKGRIRVVAKKALDIAIDIDFKIVAVNWAERTIAVEFSESVQSASPYAIGRILGDIVLTALSLAAGKDPQPVQQALSEQSYITIANGSGAINTTTSSTATIWLTRMPDARGVLEMGVGSVKLFDYVGVDSVTTEKDQLRIRFFVRS